LLGGAYLWFRDSSLVAVRDVKVSGVSGADAPAIRSALTTAARNMTTLDVDMGQLRTAVKPYPDVKRLAVSAQFPHGMRIRVIEQMPVAVVIEAGQTIPVANDGTLLRGVTPNGSLPRITLRVPPGGQRLTGAPLAEARLAAAAPSPLLGKIGDVSDAGAHGLEVQLRDGPTVYFGDAGRLAAKWNAAAAVLADAGSAGAVYIDVTDPNRPVAGAGTDSSTSASATSTGSAVPSN
jgi:cell division protein FtsQ